MFSENSQLYKLADWDKDQIIISLLKHQQGYTKDNDLQEYIREKLSTISDVYFDLNSVLLQNVEENWSFFLQNFEQLLNDYVPTKLLGMQTHLPWMSAALKHLIQKKQRVYNRTKHHCHENDWSEHKALKKEVKHMLKFQHKTDMISSPNNKSPCGIT